MAKYPTLILFRNRAYRRETKVTKLTALLLIMILGEGCAVGPNYKRPSANVPGTYRGAMPQQEAQPAAESLGDQKWWEVFQDKQLQDLIRTALQQNFDVRIAATRILEAQAQLGITRADQLPTIGAGLGKVPPRHRSGTGKSVGNKMGARIGYQHTSE